MRRKPRLPYSVTALLLRMGLPNSDPYFPLSLSPPCQRYGLTLVEFWCDAKFWDFAH